MSVFHVEENKSRSSINNFSVKRSDEKWKNFPKCVVYPKNVEELDAYKNFSIRPDDIFILGYPRSGTTRLQELVWIIANDFDYKTQLEYDCDTRIVYFE